MRELIWRELTQAGEEIIREFAHLLPRLIEMLIITLVGWVIAIALKWILRSVLRLAKFDQLSENSGASQLLNKAALPSSTELLSRFIFWVAWLGFILLGVSVLGIGGLPRVFLALFIIFFGLLAASFFSRATLLAAVNSNLPSPRLLSTSIRTLLIIFVVSMAFEELGLAEQTVLLAFGIAFGAAMLSLAIAFGMGGRDLARQFLEKRLVREVKSEKEDEPSPL